MLPNHFEQVMAQLGQALQQSVGPSSTQAYTITLQTLQIRIEVTNKGKEVLIGTNLGTLVAGAYRTAVLKEALKLNGVYPRHGKMAYSKKNNSLIFFELINLHDLSSELLLTFLDPFTKTAIAWKNALDAGYTKPQIV